MEDGETDGVVAAPVSGAILDDAALIGRITALERAFRAYEDQVPGVSVAVVGTLSGRSDLVHPVAGFEVRVSRGEERSVSLYVSANYGELRKRVGGPAEAGVLRETFNVRLSEGFGWGDSEYPDAGALAHDLLAYLQYQSDL